MSSLYIDCSMGAAGDMFTAALYELLEDNYSFMNELKASGIPGVTFEAKDVIKCGIKGTHFVVKVDGVEEISEDVKEAHAHHHTEVHEHAQEEHEHDHHYGESHHEAHAHEEEGHHDHDHHHGEDHNHEDHHHDHEEHDHDHHNHGDHAHHHAGMTDIENIVNSLSIPAKVRKDVLNVYKIIAEAESHVHGTDVTKIHFHEVGMMDAIADVTAVCLAMDKLSPDKVIVSPIHVGCGQVKCAHGIMPVPAPATAYILKGLPIYGGSIKGELCTPTGAALLKYFATEFGEMPVMSIDKIGYGMGRKDFEAANCLRILYGETEDIQDRVIGLSCNVDDMTGEEVGYAYEKLFEAGALEVYTTSVGMKKSRQGILFNVLCNESNKEEVAKAIFKHTTTIGIRETKYERYILKRELQEVVSDDRIIHRKDSHGYGVSRSKYEYDDLAKLADEKNISFREARELMKR
nr:nickel pincer cofactor biosynthesis protein LarC [Lachnospiraceae bacterium]